MPDMKNHKKCSDCYWFSDVTVQTCEKEHEPTKPCNSACDYFESKDVKEGQRNVPDMKKIIKGLEETEIMLKQAVDRGGEMAVMSSFNCLNNVTRAIAILKEQKKKDEKILTALDGYRMCDEMSKNAYDNLTKLIRSEQGEVE